MGKKVDAKSFQIVVRLGNAPQFQIAADERVSVNPQEMKFRSKGVDTQRLDLLREFIKTVLAAYPESQSASICCDGNRIVPSADCE